MRRLVALAALAVLAGGCGGGGGKSSQTTEPSTTTSTKRPTVLSNESNCDFKQITAGPRREGTCVARGTTVTVVDRGHTLHGKDYDARILGIRTETTLHTAGGGVVRANGKFVVVTLSVTNTLSAPHEFDRSSDLAFLFIDLKYLGETANAETDPSLAPFRLQSAELQPGKPATGTVVFDVPDQQAAHLTAEGSNLILVPFSEEAKRFPVGTEPLVALGYIRLWK